MVSDGFEGVESLLEEHVVPDDKWETEHVVLRKDPAVLHEFCMEICFDELSFVFSLFVFLQGAFSFSLTALGVLGEVVLDICVVC